jgi:hypothetical protein
MSSETERLPVLQKTIAFIDSFLSTGRPESEGALALVVFPSISQSLKALSVSMLHTIPSKHNLIVESTLRATHPAACQSSTLTDIDLEYTGGRNFNANVEAFLWVIGHRLKDSVPSQTALKQIERHVLLYIQPRLFPSL